MYKDVANLLGNHLYKLFGFEQFEWSIESLDLFFANPLVGSEHYQSCRIRLFAARAEASFALGFVSHLAPMRTAVFERKACVAKLPGGYSKVAACSTCYFTFLLCLVGANFPLAAAACFPDAGWSVCLTCHFRVPVAEVSPRGAGERTLV